MSYNRLLHRPSMTLVCISGELYRSISLTLIYTSHENFLRYKTVSYTNQHQDRPVSAPCLLKFIFPTLFPLYGRSSVCVRQRTAMHLKWMLYLNHKYNNSTSETITSEQWKDQKKLLVNITSYQKI